jgi:beta-mannosidase
MTIAADSGTMVKAVTATPVGQDDVSIRFTIENSAGKIVGENQRTESVIK